MKVLVAQSCPTLCDPMGCSLPGSPFHGILQARILAGVGSHSLLQGSSQPRDWNLVSWTSGRFFTVRATREALVGTQTNWIRNSGHLILTNLSDASDTAWSLRSTSWKFGECFEYYSFSHLYPKENVLLSIYGSVQPLFFLEKVLWGLNNYLRLF